MVKSARAEFSAVEHFDVAVIGLGPVGATLAGLLGRAGLSVAVFEKSRAIYAQPRAVGFDHDAMRIFQRIGIAEDLAPHIAPFRDGVYIGVGGRVIQRVRRLPPPYPFTWEPNYTCDQPGVEAVLRGALSRFPRVEVSLGQELLRLADEDESVRLEFRDDRGVEQCVRARYVVACDGASSPVRRMLGIGLESLEYDVPWIVVDVRVNEEHLAQLPSTNVQYCQPERPSTFVTCPGNHRRWEFMVLPGEAAEGPVSEERLWKLLARWLKPGEATIWRSAAYHFHALIASQWRRGRVLLAGDSAHQTPPFLGQGMCQGLRDAGNLAWKLDWVLRGRAGEQLLDTYGEERRPHVVETTRIAKEFGRIISERDPERARERDRHMLELGGGEARTLVRQELIPGLSAGLICRDALLSGKAFPQPVVEAAGRSGVLFDDLTEPGWRLVLGPAAGEVIQAAHALVRGLPVTVIALDQESVPEGVITARERDALLAQWFEAAQCTGALVRPDHYTYGAFATLAQLRSLMDEFTRALKTTQDEEARA